MMNEMMQALRAPFTPDRLEWRIGQCGKKQDGTIWAKALCYIDNRAAMERLDDVFAGDWEHKEDYLTVGNRAVCMVTIRVTHANCQRSVCGSCEVDLASDDIDPFKSAASGAMKRAVVNLGIGRYLYEVKETWAVISQNGKYSGKTKDGTWFKWDAPQIDNTVANAVSFEAVVSNAASDLASEAVSSPLSGPSPAPARQPASSAPAGVQETATSVPFGPVENPESIVCPFGKTAKGKKMGELCASDPEWVAWIAEKWMPRLWKGRLSKSDIDLKNAARILMDKTTKAETNSDPY
jgi:hypothetical protein